MGTASEARVSVIERWLVGRRRVRAKVGEIGFVRPPWFMAWLHGLLRLLVGAGLAMLPRCICRDELMGVGERLRNWDSHRQKPRFKFF